MQMLDAKAAANVIRDVIMRRPDVTAEARHIHAFATKVCHELGLDDTVHNIVAVVKALKDHGLQPHEAQEYPKMLTADGKPVKDPAGNNIVFNSADEEAAWNKDNQQPVEPTNLPQDPVDDGKKPKKTKE